MNRVIAGLLVVSSVVVAVWLPSVSSGNCPKTRVNTSLCPGTYVVCQGQPTGGPQGNKCATLNTMGSAHTILRAVPSVADQVPTMKSALTMSLRRTAQKRDPA